MSLKLHDLAKPGDILFYYARTQSPIRDRLFARFVRWARWDSDASVCVRATVVSDDVDYEFDPTPPKLRLKKINWATDSLIWQTCLFRVHGLGFNQVSKILKLCDWRVTEKRSWWGYWFGAVTGRGNHQNLEFILYVFKRVEHRLDDYLKLRPTLEDLQTSIALTKVGEDYVDLRG